MNFYFKRSLKNGQFNTISRNPLDILCFPLMASHTNEYSETNHRKEPKEKSRKKN